MSNLRYSRDSHETFVRLSHDVRQNIAKVYLLAMLSRSVLFFVAIGSQFSLIYLANMSCSKMIATKLRGVGDKLATGLRYSQ